MHELAIAQSVVSGICERVSDRLVCKVVLEVGLLSGVMPDAVRFCFDLAAQGTRVEGAALEIVVPEARARCKSCGTEFAPRDSLALCACGGADVVLLAGQELRIRSVEVT